MIIPQYIVLILITFISAIKQPRIPVHNPKGINKNHYYYTSSHFVKRLYEKYPQPTMEDHFEYIISHISLKEINNDERYSCYLRFFNLDKKLFFIYYNQFGRKYISKL